MSNNHFNVGFERENFNATVNFLGEHHASAIPDEHQKDIGGYIFSSVKTLLIEAILNIKNADFSFFEGLCHHPVEGVACLYVLDDIPKEPVNEFVVRPVNADNVDSITGTQHLTVCLYTYLR